VVGELTPVRPPGTLGRVKAQRPRLIGPVHREAEITGERNGVWVRSGGNVRAPFERGKLRRVNPRSAAGMKEARHGFGGRKPSRG